MAGKSKKPKKTRMAWSVTHDEKSPFLRLTRILPLISILVSLIAWILIEMQCGENFVC